MAAFNNTKGNDGKGQKGGAQGKGQQDTWNYARMPEVKCTTNGRWNYNSSESCKLICEYPKLTTLASGESGLLILPRKQMERLNLLLPHLMLHAPDPDFAQFMNHLATHAAKANLTTTHDDLWAMAGHPLSLPAPNERDVRDAELRTEMSDLRKALHDLVQISSRNAAAPEPFPPVPSSEPLSGSPSSKGSRASSAGDRTDTRPNAPSTRGRKSVTTKKTTVIQ